MMVNKESRNKRNRSRLNGGIAPKFTWRDWIQTCKLESQIDSPASRSAGGINFNHIPPEWKSDAYIHTLTFLWIFPSNRPTPTLHLTCLYALNIQAHWTSYQHKYLRRCPSIFSSPCWMIDVSFHPMGSTNHACSFETAGWHFVRAAHKGRVTSQPSFR